jgi:oxygen-independent coproporphyrinogen-3 oxidase
MVSLIGWITVCIFISLIEEFRIVLGSLPGLALHSIYFGGGTPSLIDLVYYQEILSSIEQNCTLSEECEISLEANPGTLSREYLQGLRRLGFNRISIGIQSTDPYDLVRLDRIHDINDILTSIRFARLAGFTNVNLDLIFGLPWQNLSGWTESLKRALDLHPEHFSLYSLIIEPGTLLHSWHQRGLVKLQDQDLEGDMYEAAMNLLDIAGYEHYEISNWARRDKVRDFRCRHNLQYWLNQPYLGLGAGAHGYAQNTRTVNTSTIPEYIECFTDTSGEKADFPDSPASVSTEYIDQAIQMKDFMMLGLRLVEDGVTDTRFRSWYGISMKDVFGGEISSLISKGLLEWVGDKGERLRLTHRGVMVANQVFMEFV